MFGIIHYDDTGDPGVYFGDWKEGEQQQSNRYQLVLKTSLQHLDGVLSTSGE